MSRGDEVLCGYILGLALFAGLLLAIELYGEYKKRKKRGQL